MRKSESQEPTPCNHVHSLGILTQIHPCINTKPMPRFLTCMILLGIVGLIGATAVFLRSNPPSASSGDGAMNGGTPTKPFGNTAISHGSPLQTSSELETPRSAQGQMAQIGLGQHVVIATALSLLPAVPDGPPGMSTPPAGFSVAAGTVATVLAIAPAVPPDTRQTETYYKVQLSSGQAGWVPERALRPASIAPRESSP